LHFGDLPDYSFELLIILSPFLHRRFELAGNIERNGFAPLLPGDEKDGMLRPLVMTSAVIFSTLSGSGDEGSFDPGAEILNLAE
jgi:hypothetical protein